MLRLPAPVQFGFLWWSSFHSFRLAEQDIMYTSRSIVIMGRGWNPTGLRCRIDIYMRLCASTTITPSPMNSTPCHVRGGDIQQPVLENPMQNDAGDGEYEVVDPSGFSGLTSNMS
jgi:hypothetical protein